MKKKTSKNNGLLLIDKPSGLTSHDVVARVRRILNEKKVGHAGTLDPMATGLLVLGVGPSTRLLRFATAEEKRYTGSVQFGSATDTLDADGVVLATKKVPTLTPELMNATASKMLGAQSQIPPMVSAIKVDGQRLHSLARQGIEIEREPRDITIESFTLAPTSNPTVWTFDVRCSVGTYVRVLLSDLAESLGTLGHLTSLRRESSGTHSTSEAVNLEQLEELAGQGLSALHPPRAFVEHLPSITAPDEVVARIRMGQRVALDMSKAHGEIAVMEKSGDLVGVLRPRGDVWQPELILPTVD